MSVNHSLTKREQAIYNLLVRGMTYWRIANDLELKTSTVRTVVNRIYDKLAARDVLEATQQMAQQRPPEPELHFWRPWEKS